MIKDFFENILLKSIEASQAAGKFPKFEEELPRLFCEIPKNAEFGDFAINVSSLARLVKMPPVQIANVLSEFMLEDAFNINIVNGFINFKLGEKFLIKILKDILEKKEDFGKINLGKGKKVNIEYVSANPTGPFHIGHGRWAAVGSSLAEIMKYTGYDVFQEFYINDAGGQIQRLAKSLENRVKELKGENVIWEEDLYKGEYLIPTAQKYLKDNRGLSYADFAKEEMENIQKNLLKKFKVNFDMFFSETSLYKNGEVSKCVEELETKGKLYKQDGAIWFKSSEYGDSQDRVLKKSDGTNTYLTADIAYHKNKLDRGFDLLINIWGADHHGYIPRMKAAIEALGYDSTKLEVLLGQLVNIVENGETVRMGKRKKMVTLDELVEEVGADATRYWMLMRSIDTMLDFDIELAKTKSDKNPVFYVQYAHARCCSILKRATEEHIDTETGKKLPSYIQKEEFDKILDRIEITKLFDNDLKADESTRKLILKLEEFQTVVGAASRNRAPYLLCKYAESLAFELHHFYNFTRVLTEDKEMGKTRILIVYAVKLILKQTLSMLLVKAPEKM